MKAGMRKSAAHWLREKEKETKKERFKHSGQGR